MAIGFPASFIRTERYGIDRLILRKLVVDSFERLEWRFHAVDENTSMVDRPIGPGSWGEKITVSVEEDGSVRVKSVCAWPTQIFDWGANKRNVDEFFLALTGAIRNSALDPHKPPSAFDDEGKTPVERALRDNG